MKCMLANEVRTVDEVDISSYIAERKLDGVRCLLVDGHLVNRRDICYDFQFKEVLEELKKVDADLDGEMCYFPPDSKVEQFNVMISRCGTTSPFKAEILREKYPVKFMVFDILRKGKKDLRNEPILKRKKALKDLKLKLPHVEIVSFTKDVKKLWTKAKKEEWEGIMLKHNNGRYVDSRSPQWLKLKNLKVESVRFNEYEVNNAGITLIDADHDLRVQYGGRTASQVQREIDSMGYADFQVHYLNKTKEGKLFQPVIKAENKRRIG